MAGQTDYWIKYHEETLSDLPASKDGVFGRAGSAHHQWPMAALAPGATAAVLWSASQRRLAATRSWSEWETATEQDTAGFQTLSLVEDSAVKARMIGEPFPADGSVIDRRSNTAIPILTLCGVCVTTTQLEELATMAGGRRSSRQPVRALTWRPLRLPRLRAPPQPVLRPRLRAPPLPALPPPLPPTCRGDRPANSRRPRGSSPSRRAERDRRGQVRR